MPALGPLRRPYKIVAVKISFLASSTGRSSQAECFAEVGDCAGVDKEIQHGSIVSFWELDSEPPLERPRMLRGLCRLLVSVFSMAFG